MQIQTRLSELRISSLTELAQASSTEELEVLRLRYLGKKGALSEVLKGLGSVSAEERPKVGALANELKVAFEEALQARRTELERIELNQRIEAERLDVSLPSRKLFRGSLHPITQTTRELIRVFGKLGFERMTGPEIETDYMCFEAVNIPADHPARDMQDTFFLGPGTLLRTQTTAIQTRVMRQQAWPIRIVCPGAVYRNDSDSTHSPMFHQLEGLWIDRGVSMADLKGTLEFFARELFGPKAKIRLRPSYFPFVEPGAEVDVLWTGRGREEWLEILGAGMVHPRLLELAGYNPKEVSGFAFGLGIDRIAMLLHKIPDLRLMFSGNRRFLDQF